MFYMSVQSLNLVHFFHSLSGFFNYCNAKLAHADNVKGKNTFFIRI